MALALGMTVSEAKARMTYREALQWSAYFEKHGYASGPRGLMPEVQQGFALLASILINVNGGYQGGRKAKIEDFLPQRHDDGASPEDVASLLASLGGAKPRDTAIGKRLWRRAVKER